MTIRADSYSSAEEVTAVTRHLLDGAESFNSGTRPTLAELEKFIDRSSGVLNMALLGAGFTPAAVIANSTAKLAGDEWVTVHAAQWAEVTQRGAGWSDEQNQRLGQQAMMKDAAEYVAMIKPGLKEAGITTGKPSYEGLTFTGLTAQEDRADPDNSSLEQPSFTREQWDNNG